MVMISIKYLSLILIWSILLIAYCLSFALAYDKTNELTSKRKRANNSTNLSDTTKEKAPKFHFATWDENGNICILAKFEAQFTITYNDQYGKTEVIDRLPPDAQAKGRCDSLLDELPIMDITWRGGFTFRMIFQKNSGKNTWGIQSMDLLYNTGDSLFYGSVDGSVTVAKSKPKSLAIFETPLGISYLCPSPPVINLYNPDDEPTVLIRLTNIQIQAYKIKDSKFSPIQRCGQVGFGSGVPAPFYIVGYQQDESVPMVVGSITIFFSISTVAGYAVYRSFFVKRVDYDTMA